MSWGNSDKRVVDSNELISEKIKQLNEKINQTDIPEDGFFPGLSPVDVSDILEGDEHIIGDKSDEEAQERIEQDKIQKRDSIIAEAKSEAETMIKKANEDANAIIVQAKSEAEAIRQDAKAKGLAEGVAKAEAEKNAFITEKQSEYEALKNQIISEYKQKEAEMEPVLVDTILKIFSEMTHAIALDKRDMILTLVNNVMSRGEVSRNFVIKVCKEDAIFLNENKDKIIGSVRKDIHIEIVADPSMKRNECLIDTDTGVYDCSLDIQLENLITDIKILSCTGV